MYVQAQDIKNDNEMQDVTDKVMEQLESIIEGLDQQPMMVVEMGKVSREDPHTKKNYYMPKDFPEFYKTHTRQDELENIPKTSRSNIWRGSYLRYEQSNFDHAEGTIENPSRDGGRN